jgi:hypothetical protein
MRSFERELRPKRVGFIVCSEESNIDGLENFNYVHSCGAPIEDIYALAEGDYIISNGSTFSRWASFLGKKPIYIIQNKDHGFGGINTTKVFSYDHTDINMI